MPEFLVRELTPPPDPVECCERLEPLPCRLFLDSATLSPRLGRYSFLTADPVGLVRAKNMHAEYLDLDAGHAHSIADPVATVRDLLSQYPRTEPGPVPFQGGAAGFIAYEWGHTLERLPYPRYDDLALPDLELGLYDWVLAWDHTANRAWLICNGLGRCGPASRARTIQEILEGATPAARRIAPMTVAPRGNSPAFDVRGLGVDVPGLRSSFTPHGYVAAVERVREYIYAGDIFQANLSQRFDAPLTEPAWTLYRQLRTRNAAPFAAFLDFPGATIASASPERFLRVDTTGQVETRPIKGTRPRGIGPEHDAHLGQALTESDKDRAENLMIVDLMRNDLSRVCRSGTVDVPELFALEHYATVHHLVSTVTGRLAEGEDALSLLRATFPGGSITGAPKLRAMEIIAELEPAQRGIYCGSLGYWSVTGAMDSSIAIRTAVVRDGRVYFSAGGGIVADSESTQEYRETLDKARGIIDALLVAYGPAHR